MNPNPPMNKRRAVAASITVAVFFILIIVVDSIFIAQGKYVPQCVAIAEGFATAWVYIAVRVWLKPDSEWVGS